MSTLSFTLSLIDRVTRPLRGVGAGLRGFAKQSEKAFEPMAKGFLALWGVKKAIQAALDPAVQMFNTLQKASARGVGEEALKKLSKDALLFSSRYGTSALAFVESSHLIKSSINGLTDRELPRMTKAANLLAAGTGESAQAVGTYYGAMYNQFRGVANKMGRVKFMENLTDQSAYMVSNFGLSIQKIQDMMKGTKGAGSNLGVGLSEQFAVLGQLSRTMGNEGAGAYEQFLNKAVEGGKALGISLTDSNGKLLAMPDIIQKLQNKYGKSIQGNIKAQAELDKAFGGGSKVIKALYGNVDEMRKHMDSLGKNTGMKNATSMANKMADPFARCTSILFALRAAIGESLVPVLYPLIDNVADAGEQFTKWMKMFPNIARWIGYIAVGFLSFAAAGAAANIVMGITRFIMIGLRGIMSAFSAVLKIGRVFILAYRAALLAWNAAMRILRATLLAIRIAAMLAGVSFTFMTWPILLIIAAIALLAVGIYLLIKHWDKIKAAVMDTTAFKIIAAYWEVWKTIFLYVVDIIGKAWEKLCKWFEDISPFDSVADMAASLGNVFGNLWTFLKKSFSDTYSWIVDKLNMIPGINIDLMPTPAAAPAATALTGTNLKGVGQGGISKEIKNSSSNKVDNSRHVGVVNITQQEPMTPAQLNEWIELNAG
ncbi:phage tail tape measure protein [Pragia fontium]|uniref:Phage tail tape measure protein, TP901 family, core region n=1 Tax=Pragia fontium DSM 5563 = ATCC 49100 TaxID=1122977 RepID=A0AAJ4W9J0_9GAMM|nr:phage tail tape measure protein [Pragia fontium]SFC49948.1 phage tail tape measure protein, TP901 family, core region [Pragia fontium DSM 5563 = ATCC 49100]